MVNHFFGDSGLTSTSANHIANIAKEYILSRKEILDNFSFVSSTTSAAGHTYKTRTETSKDVYEQVPDIVKDIQEAYRLIAWLREALKEKEHAVSEILTLEQYVVDVLGETVPTAPKKGNVLTEQEIVRSWDVEKYNSLFVHQTNASTIGELIHNNGGLTNARKEFYKKQVEPNVVNGDGRDLTVTEFTSDYTSTEVDKLFFELQKLHREEQAKYNKLRHEIDSAITDSQIEVDRNYNLQYDEYCKKYFAQEKQYDAYVKVETKKLKDLKIIIPESLKRIYEKVQLLGKD